nr:hypothetical protein BaRGS_017663 [Batillaria attramentaria]
MMGVLLKYLLLFSTFPDLYLHAIPDLPAGILQLDLSLNRFTAIDSDIFPDNVTGVISLDFSYNMIRYISDGAFRSLVNLTTVILRGTLLDRYERLSPVFAVPKLTLMPALEGLMGLRLCVHERDFIPGKNILDNIADCVETSKKVLMLFSISFAKSPWCQFELNYCLSHVMDCDDELIVVFLHDIPSRDMTPAMMAVTKTTTYIEWVDEDEARDSFWRRIMLALHEVLPGV